MKSDKEIINDLRQKFKAAKRRAGLDQMARSADFKLVASFISALENGTLRTEDCFPCKGAGCKICTMSGEHSESTKVMNNIRAQYKELFPSSNITPIRRPKRK